MTNLGGHCLETLIEAFDAAHDDRPTLFIAYTVKGYRPAVRGPQGQSLGADEPRPDRALRTSLGIAEGEEWAPWGGLGDNAAPRSRPSSTRRRWRATRRATRAEAVPVPAPARARRRRAIDAGGVRAHPARSRQVGSSAGRPHRHHLARRHRLDQSRRVRQPARPVPPAGAQRRVRGRQDPVGAEMVWRTPPASISSWASPSTICS